MLIQVQVYWQWTLRGLRAMQVRDERGSTVETVILTAVFAALAIAVGAIIVIKVTAKAHSINLN
jgi:hypothetical protein